MKLLAPLLLALAFAYPEPAGAGQPEPYRVKDIRPASSAGISDYSRISVMGNKIVFAASDGATGYELWQSDGTEAGTTLLKDLITGSASSSPIHPVLIGNNLFFRAGNKSIGIYKSDGTSAGTSPLFYSGSEPWFPGAADSNLYYSASSSTYGEELWKTDGTIDGTGMVKDLTSGVGNSSLWAGTAIGNIYYFSTVSSYTDPVKTTKLWRTDGSANGTFVLQSFTNESYGITNLTVDGGRFFFAANDGVHGLELWKSNGSSTGTVMVKDLAPGTKSGISGSAITAANGLAFFSAEVDGQLALWRSDGTPSVTFPLRSLVNPVTAPLAVIGNEVFFSVPTVGGMSIPWSTHPARRSPPTYFPKLLPATISEGRRCSRVMARMPALTLSPTSRQEEPCRQRARLSCRSSLAARSATCLTKVVAIASCLPMTSLPHRSGNRKSMTGPRPARKLSWR